MKIDSDTIKHIASLARLNITAAESRQYQKDIEEILKAFEVLNSMPSESEPSFQPIPLEAPLREDEKEECISRDAALSNTKHKEKGFFRGPRVV